MMKKVYKYILLFVSVIVYSQNNNVDSGLMIEEQPKTEALVLSENITIPLFTIKTGNITYPIELKYNMTGIGVDQVAESTGLGWQLSESFIYREVEDKIDVNQSNGGRYPLWSGNGYEGQNNTIITHNRPELFKKGYQTVKGNNFIEHYNTNIGDLDHEPDVFNVVSPYFNTTFYYPSSTTEAKELTAKNTIIESEVGEILIDYTKTKQLYGSNSIPSSDNRIFEDYKKFTITQSNGLISIFDQPDYVHSVNYVKYLSSYESNIADYINAPYLDRLYLSKVVDPLTGKGLNFSYQTFSTEDNHVNAYSNYQNTNKPYYREGVFYKHNYKYPNNFITDDCYIFKDLPEGSMENPNNGGANNKIYKRYIKKKRLQIITFDHGSVEFIYGLDRQDFHNDKALTRIEVKNKENKIVASYDLNYDYFASEQYRNEFSKRLKLTSITDIEGGKHSLEYYEDNKIPQIGSYNKDFYGYCNTSDDSVVNPNDISSYNYPIYYYYPDKYEFSIMPYNITGQKKFILEGVVNKEPNELAKTWSLKKIIYPTGGFTQFNLETNTFNLWGSDLNGPGVRIASKTIAESDTDINPRKITYNYSLPNGNSSGTIYNFPLAGYPLKKLFTSYEDTYGDLISAGSNYPGENNLYQSFLLYQVLSRSNAKVNYSLVEQKELNKKTIFASETYYHKVLRSDRTFYPNNGINDFRQHCISEFLKTNSGLGFDNNSFLIQNPVYKKTYDNNIIVEEKQYKYKNYLNKEVTGNYSPSNYHFAEIKIRNANTAFDIFPDWNYENLLTVDKKYFARNNYLVEEQIKYFFSSGNLLNTFKYYYGNILSYGDPLFTGSFMTDNTGNSSGYTYEFPDEWYYGLVNANMLTTKMAKVKWKNGIQLSKSVNYYGPDSILPGLFYEESTKQDIKIKIFIESYDNKNNLQSYKDSDNISTVILYGYNQTLPIAVIKGITLSGLFQELNLSDMLDLEIVKKSNLDIDTSSENLLIDELDKFRKQLNANGGKYPITTYTYDTLIGTTSVTPPTGMRQKYIYNSVTNKLEKIIDKDGNIIKEFKYNYKH